MKPIRILSLLLAAVLLAGCGVLTPEPESERTYPTQAILQTDPAETLGTEPPTTPSEPETVPTEPESSQPPAEPAEDALVRVRDYIPNIAQELAYATRDNFTGKVVYRFLDAYLRYGTVKKLAQAQEKLAQQGLGLLIWDGFRPVYAQAALWDAWPDGNYVSHPVYGYRAHCRGNAVDVTLVVLATGEKLGMPTGFDDFSAKADRNYADCGESEAANARLLEAVLESCGFEPYSAEWWHFTDTVDYPVDEYFDPASISLWRANCEEYINLRIAPAVEAEAVAQIPAGQTMTLLGWAGSFAYVDYRGQWGFVNADYILPAEEGS